jgi:hypothetical protein
LMNSVGVFTFCHEHRYRARAAMKRTILFMFAAFLWPGAASAHHGWGSYDVSNADRAELLAGGGWCRIRYPNPEPIAGVANVREKSWADYGSNAWGYPVEDSYSSPTAVHDTPFQGGRMVPECVDSSFGRRERVCAPRDSGSLVVAEDGSSAVGVLFAATRSGEYGWISPMPCAIGAFGGLQLVGRYGLT